MPLGANRLLFSGGGFSIRSATLILRCSGITRTVDLAAQLGSVLRA